jgi:hypothetical protein
VRSSSGGIEYVADGSSDDRQLIDSLEHDFETFAGSLNDQRAVDVLVAYSDNGPQARCVERKGMVWHWQLGIGPAATRWFWDAGPVAAPPALFITRDARANSEVRRLSAYYDTNPPHALDKP